MDQLLKQLPANLLEQLAQAAKVSDTEKIDEIINRIDGLNSSLATSLKKPECSELHYGKEDWYIKMKKEQEQK